MGKSIDRLSLTIVTFAAAFFFFYRCSGQLLLSLLLAPLLLLCLLRLLHRPRKFFAARQANRKRARHLIDSWPRRPASEGEKEAQQILSATLDSLPPDVRLIFLPFHASKLLSAEDVLSRHRESQTRTLIISACPASHAAFAAAESCTKPEIHLLDRNAMIRLARRTTLCAPSPAPVRLSARMGAMLDRIRPSRCWGPALFLLGLYVYSGIWSYFLSAALLMLICLLRLRIRSRQSLALFQ